MQLLFKRPAVNDAQQVIDKFSVKELIEFERFCRDNALWEEMKKCFAPVSTVTVSWFQGSGEGFVDASSKMQQYAPHKLYNTEVWLHNDKAVAATMATITIRQEIDGHLLELLSDAKLFYRLQKIAGAWYVVSMDGIYEKDALVPVTPSPDIEIPAADLAPFRSSYANLSYMLSRQGYTVNPDLPGIDKPELVEKIYAEADAWLAS